MNPRPEDGSVTKRVTERVFARLLLREVAFPPPSPRMLRRAVRPTNYWDMAARDNKKYEDQDASPRRSRIRLGRLESPAPSASFRSRWPLRNLSFWRLLYIVVALSSSFAILFILHALLLRTESTLHPNDEAKSEQLASQVLSHRRPVVNRKHIANLATGEEELPDFKAAEAVYSRWPPIVTVIPEVRPSAQSTRQGLTTTSVDAQFCRDQPRCRFLLPLWIGEQESRGRIHLTQILHLAASLNRTVILPNVGKSRIGACGKWDFSAYYDTGSFARQLKDLSGDSATVMLMDDFKTWVSMRPQHPVGHLVFFHERAATPSEVSQASMLLSEDSLDLYIDRQVLGLQDPRLKNAFCLKSKFRNLRLDLRRPLSLHANISDATPQSSSGDIFQTVLQDEDILQTTARLHLHDADLASPQDAFGVDEPTENAPFDPDVLVVHWDLRHLAFATPPTTPGLAYSENLWELAGMLAPPSKPYLAVHWRMETVEPELLPDCAEALVDTLSILLAEPTLAKDIKTVWLATDMPGSLTSGVSLQGPALRSNTFKVITGQHTEALGILKAAFDRGGPLEDWTVTGLAEQMQRVRSELASAKREFSIGNADDDGLIWEDPGIWGILDKMVAMESTLFVSGARGCGRVRCVPHCLGVRTADQPCCSSFTRQIVDYRSQEQSKIVPRNVVELFG